MHEDLLTPTGVIVEALGQYGAWDVYADDDLQQATARELAAGRLHRSVGAPADDAAREAGRLPTRPGQLGASARADEQRALDAPADARIALAKRPRPTKSQRRALQLTQTALSLRASGWSVRDIAAELAVTPSTITGWFTSHRRHVAIEDINAQLDQIAVPLATENLIHGLLAGDKDYTLETLKGRGQLRRHGEADKPPERSLPELRIVFEAGGGNHHAIEQAGRIVGTAATPKTIDGTVVETRMLDSPDASDTAGIGHGHVQVPRAAPPAAGPGDPGDVPARGV